MATFISKFKTIADKLQEPLTELKLVTMALRVLHPDYQRYMETYMQTHSIENFKTLLSLGKKHEKAVEIRSRYVAPKPKDKSIMPELAYEEKPAKTKIAAIQVSQEEEAETNNESTKRRRKVKSLRRNRLKISKKIKKR